MHVLSVEKCIVKNDALRMSLRCHKQGRVLGQAASPGADTSGLLTVSIVL